jgi:hypothetical protein
MRFISRSVLGVLVAVLALSALASTSAFAASTNNPQWKVNGVLLGSGQSDEVGIVGGSAWKISNFGLTTECSKVSLKAGAKLLGGDPGTSSETITYSGCSEVSRPKCKINGNSGTITTQPLTGTLAFETKEAAEKETGPTIVVLKPTTGKVFLSYVEEEASKGLHECFYGGERTFTGELALRAPEGATELTVHSFEPSTIKWYYVNTGGKTVETNVKQLAWAGTAATMQGEMKVELAGKQNWSIFG